MIVICKDSEDLKRLPADTISMKDELVVNKQFYNLVSKMIRTIDANRREALTFVLYKGKAKRAVVRGWRFHDT